MGSSACKMKCYVLHMYFGFPLFVQAAHINIVEDGDVEREPLSPLDRVGKPQLCKEVLADEQGGRLGDSKPNLHTRIITDFCWVFFSPHC